jgi:S1-C subfamily serine protease
VVHTGLATAHKSGVGALTEGGTHRTGRLGHTLHLQPGDSGGALVSLSGEAIAINHAVGRIQSFGASFFSGSYSMRPDVAAINKAIAKDLATHSP